MASRTAMKPKLTDITTTYHSFEDDQVLTATQLNEFLTYFEDQDRLTRISLSGVGIVCGFKVNLIQERQFLPVSAEVLTTAERRLFTSNISKIVVEQGSGVTTDGDLFYLRENSETKPYKKLKISSETYTHFKIYDDNKSGYERFIRDNKQIPLWELIPASEITAETTDSALSLFPNLQDMVVLLYLECYEDEPNLCDGVSCDNQGREQVARLRTLLVSQTDADYLLKSDVLFNKHELMSTYLKMKDLSVKRVVVNAANTGRLTDLKASFELSNEAQLLTDLKDGLTLMRNKIHQYYPGHPLDSILSVLSTKLPAATPSQSIYFQYRYDLLKDIVDSYNEAKELFIEVATECCPSIASFPKHLMLGKLRPTEEDSLVSKYRHKFYKSPILVDESKEFEPFIWTLFRMLHQLNAYPTLPETGSGGLYRNDIKITPSAYRTELGKKAIPFYYNLNNSLLRAWDREKTLKGKYKLNLSYNTGLLDASPAIQTPLRYNLEGSNFLRIEGHQGRDYKEVMAKIDQIKKENGLSFDLKAISIDLDSSIVIDTTNYECEFEDLAVLLTAWVKEQECTIAKVVSLVSAFSIKEPGRNIKDTLFLPRTTFSEAAIAEVGVAKTTTTTKATSSATSTPIASIVTTADQRKAIANNEQEFGRANTVLENLTPTENTVGHSYLQAVLQNPKGTSAEFVTEANLYANEVVQVNNVVWVADQYNALVKNSIQIMAYSHVLSNSIPMSIAGITDLVISRYNTNINNLCSVLNKIQVSLATTKRASSTNLTGLSDTNRSILELLISQLSNICCASKQLQTLLVEIDRRKDAILEKLTLKKFVEQHPGLEHLGGVEQGGTFVLVYLRKGATANTLSSSAAISETVGSTLSSSAVLPKSTLSQTMSLASTSSSLTLESAKTTTTSTKQTLSSVARLTPTERILTDTRALAINPNLVAVTQNLFTAPNGTVVADFALPYMCCSDCSPINFIMPAPIVRLSLQNEILCLSGTAPITITFNVEPATGVIKADQVIAGMTISGKQLTINPTLFPAASLNKAINFTVNDQITSCKLTVVKPVAAAISAPTNPISNPVVTFTAVGSFPSGTLFSWNFGDGGTSTLRNVTHSYQLPVNELNSLDVTLTVTPANGACPTIITKNLVFDPTKISLADSEFCFNDETPYAFTITPAGATADISGDGVDPATNTFTPSNSFVGDVPIYLGGDEVFTVKVKPEPTVAVMGGMTDFGLNLNGIANDATSYVWTFTDLEGNEVLPPIEDAPLDLTTLPPVDTLNPLIPRDELLKLPSGIEFIVTLTATNNCGVKSAEKRFFAPQTTSGCLIDARLRISTLNEFILRFAEGDPLMERLTGAQRELYSEVLSYFNIIVQDATPYLSGDKNDELLSKIGFFANEIYNQIKLAGTKNPDQQKALVILYNYVLQNFLSFIQCQVEGDLKLFTPLFDLYKSHLDPSSELSFTVLKVTIDPDGSLREQIAIIAEFRPDRSESKTYLDAFVGFLTPA